MTFNLKADREAYLSGQSNDLEAIRAHIPTAQDVAEMTEKERHMLLGPEADLDKKEGAIADGFSKFAGMTNLMHSIGFEFFGPGEHPLPTRFAAKRPGEEFTGRSAIRDLSQAKDFISTARQLSGHRRARF